MNVVLRPVNDRFLEDVVFPAFQLGVVDTAAGLQRLLDGVGDLRTRFQLEQLTDRTLGGSFFGLEEDDWLEALHRLLFVEWRPGEAGWEIALEHAGYAGRFEHALHAALMLQDPSYPYWDAAAAEAFQADWLGKVIKSGLVGLVAGIWDPFPPFPPDQVLVTVGRALYRRSEDLAMADWSFRPSHAVTAWARRLPEQVEVLLRREQKRLGRIRMPEAPELLGYWRGTSPEPPALSVAFSGLGPSAGAWVREVGDLVREVRQAASAGRALTSLITQEGAAD